MGTKEIKTMVEKITKQRFCDRCGKDIDEYWGCNACGDQYCDECKRGDMVSADNQTYCNECHTGLKDVFDELNKLHLRSTELYEKIWAWRDKKDPQAKDEVIE